MVYYLVFRRYLSESELIKYDSPSSFIMFLVARMFQILGSGNKILWGNFQQSLFFLRIFP